MSGRQQPPPQQQQQQQQPPSSSPLRSPPSSPSPPQPFAIVRLAAAIRSNRDRIASAERRATGQTEPATRHQCDLALRFIAHYAAHNAESKAYAAEEAAAAADLMLATGDHYVHGVDATGGRSLFEVFTGVAMHLRVSHAVCVRLDADRSYLREAAILGDCCTFSEHSAAVNNNGIISASKSFGSTQIIYQSGDAAAAFAELNNAHADRTAPWRIRVCWVQEALRAQFEDTFGATAASPSLLAEHVRGLGGEMRWTSTQQPLVVDVPLALWLLPPPANDAADRTHHDAATAADVVLVQFFRTAKEAIALLRQQAPASTQNLSVWTENFSVTLELAHGLPDALNVWQNCVGLLDPQVPFTFPADAPPLGLGAGAIYGSELALCQTVITRLVRNSPAAAARGGVELAKLTAGFADELAAENGDFSAWRLFDRVAFMTAARRRSSNNDGTGDDVVPVADWVLEARDTQKRRLITNVVFNRFQTIVVPYGTIFAN